MTETTQQTLARLVASVPMLGDINHPNWSDCDQTWRAYIPEELRDGWAMLPDEAKMIAAVLGDELVSREREC
jgi:hypothetical protein